MTIEERMEIIRNKARKNKEEEANKLSAEDAKRNKLILQIKNLHDRINSLLILANECDINGIKIPQDGYYYSRYNSAKEFGYDAEFIAEGIRHHVGFINGGKYEWVGIKNGGACGVYDFYTNGSEVFSIHQSTKAKAEPRICDMEQFLEEFPVFEKAFYNWIDNLQWE